LKLTKSGVHLKLQHHRLNSSEQEKSHSLQKPCIVSGVGGQTFSGRESIEKLQPTVVGRSDVKNRNKIFTFFWLFA